MQDAHDLAEVARVLGAILGLCSAAALDRAQLMPQAPPSPDHERAGGGEAARSRSARRSGPGGSCLRARARTKLKTAASATNVSPGWMKATTPAVM